MRRSLLLAILAAFVPASARSADTVAVMGAGICDDPALLDQVRTIRQALARRLGPLVLSEDATVRALGDLPRGSLAGAKLLVEQAEADIVSDAPLARAESLKRDQRAQERLQSALAVLLSISPSSERSQTLLKVRMLELQLYSGTGRRPELEQALESIFHVAPAFRFDPNTYSPRQIADYEEMRKKVLARSTATLQVTSRPAGIVVFVDGFEIGPAPVTLKLPPGAYRVEVPSGAHRGMAHTVNVTGDGAEVGIEAELERSVLVDGGPCVEGRTFGDRVAKLARLGALMGVQTVVAVRAEQGPGSERYLVAEAIETAAGPRRNGVAMKLVDGKPAATALDRLWDVLASAQRVSFQVSPPDTSVLAIVPSPAPPPARWMRPSAYVAGGIALGLAGLAVYEGVSSRNAYDKADGLMRSGGLVSPTDKATYEKSVKDGDSAKKGMYVSVGAAIVFGGAAGLLGYLSREPGPPVIRF